MVFIEQSLGKEWTPLCKQISAYIQHFFMEEGRLVAKCLEWKCTKRKAIYTLLSQLAGGCRKTLEHKENRAPAPRTRGKSTTTGSC